MADLQKKEIISTSQVVVSDSKDEFQILRQFLPLNVLVEEMKQPNLKKRVQSVKSISSIGIALGPERTRALLIPFMNQLMTDEEDIQKEVLKLIPTFVNLVGGSYHSNILMDIIFDYLYKCDDGAVKDIALDSLKDLFRQIDLRHFEKLLIDFINRILSNDHFRSKEIALMLMPEIFIALNERYQLEVIDILVKMSSDSTPMVRKTVACKLKDFAKLIPPAPEDQLLSIFDRLMADENDYVRMPLLESLIPFSQVCLEKTETQFVDILKTIINDKSVKVRANLVDFVEDIQKAFTPAIFNELLVPTYLEFLDTDADNNLKNKCLSNIVSLFKNVPSFTQIFIPKLKLLTKDKSLSVKQNLCDAVIMLLQEVATERVEGIEELFIDLLEESDNETRFKFFKKIEDFGKMGVSLSREVVKSILVTLDQIAQGKKWRMRSSALSTMSRLISESKMNENVFDDLIINMIKQGLADNTAEVRIMAAKTLGILAANFSECFMQQVVLPPIMAQWDSSNYLFRIGAPLALKYSITHFSQLFVENYVLTQIDKGVIDRVPNIRIATIEIISIIMKTFPMRTQQVYRKCLEILAKDHDQQVKQLSLALLSQ